MRESIQVPSDRDVVWRPLQFGLIAAGAGMVAVYLEMLGQDSWWPSIGYVAAPILCGALGSRFLNRSAGADPSPAIMATVGTSTVVAWVVLAIGLSVGIGCVVPADQFRVPDPTQVRSVVDSFPEPIRYIPRETYPLEERVQDHLHKSTMTMLMISLPVGILLVILLANHRDNRITRQIQQDHMARLGYTAELHRPAYPATRGAAIVCGVTGAVVGTIGILFGTVATPGLPFLGWVVGPLLGYFLLRWYVRRRDAGPPDTSPSGPGFLASFVAAIATATLLTGTIAAAIPAEQHRLAEYIAITVFVLGSFLAFPMSIAAAMYRYSENLIVYYRSDIQDDPPAPGSPRNP